MRNTTILFGLVLLIALLSFLSKENISSVKKDIYFEKSFKGENSSIKVGDQLPIVSFKRD